MAPIMTAGELARRIETALPGARARVEGGDAHFSAEVTAPAFAGRTRIEQHRMIYDLFRDEMASEAIHALALRTSAPAPGEGTGGRDS